MSSLQRKRRILPPEPLPLGAPLGRFELRNVLGLGTFGFVYRAVDPQDDTEFAVKEYLPGHLAHRVGPTQIEPRSSAEAEAFEQGLRFFLNEGKLLAGLEHPAMVKVHGSWQANGSAYIAMTLATGRNLSDTYRTRWRAPSEVSMRTMIETLLGAIEQLHANGLQHRDIAPQNIVVQPNGRLLLMDLGSPRRVSAARGETGPTGPRDGYAPIELYGTAHGHARGPWTDIYALGATLHFMIAGKPPPAAQERREGDRVGFTLRRPDHRHSLELLAVIDWMLAPLPKARPQSVAELRTALAGGGVPAAHAPTSRERFQVRLRRWRPWLLAGLALTLVVGLAVTYEWLRRQDKLPLWLYF